MAWPAILGAVGKSILGGLTSGISGGISARIGAQIAGRRGDPNFGFGGPQVYDQMVHREWMAGQNAASESTRSQAAREIDRLERERSAREHQYRLEELRETYRGETMLRMLMNPLDQAQLIRMMAEDAARGTPGKFSTLPETLTTVRDWIAPSVNWSGIFGGLGRGGWPNSLTLR